MKRLLTLSLILSSFFCAAQPIVHRSNPANTVSDARWQAQYNLFAPRFADTTAANVQKGIDSCGAMIYTYDINSFWFRQCSPKKWIQFIVNQPPAPLTPSFVWYTTGNYFSSLPSHYGLGTISADNLVLKANDTTRVILPYTGLSRVSSGGAFKAMVFDTTNKTWAYSDGAENAWNINGNLGINPATNFVGPRDSVTSFSLKNSTYWNAFFERRGWDVFPYVRRPGLTAVGIGAGGNLIPLVIAGTTNGQLNTFIGSAAGATVGATYDTTFLNPSNQNTAVGVWSFHDMQNNNSVTTTGRNVGLGESTCFTCITPGEVTAVGVFVGERGNRPYKNSGFGSNALRTMNDSYGMTAAGAYASAFEGGVVTAINLSDFGSGYTTATVTISAPPVGTPGSCSQTATGTAIIVGGQVIGVTITNPGCGYNEYASTRYTGFPQPYPTVTITGDGTGAVGTVVVRSAYNSVSMGHAADWQSRANREGIYIGVLSNYNTRYYDNGCAAIGPYSGIDVSISALQGLTKAWSLGYGARVSTNNTLAIGGVYTDSNRFNYVVINNITGDSTFTVYGNNGGGIHATGGANFEKDSYVNSIRIGRGLNNQTVNTALGSGSLGSTTTSTRSTAVGYQTAQSITTSSDVTAIGYGTQRLSTTGVSGNTSIGSQSLFSLVFSNPANTALGTNSMFSLTTATRFGFGRNTAIGMNSLFNATAAEANSVNGYQAGSNISSGAYNVATGNEALGVTAPLAAGHQIDGNTAIGTKSQWVNVGGDYNTSIGYGSASALVNGSYNLFIGGFDGSGVANKSNHGFFSDGAGVVRIMFDSTGAVGIGTSSTAPATTSLLELKSTTRGFLPPRMTAAQRLAISSPAVGLVVYDTDSSRLFAYQGAWKGIKWTSEGGGSGTPGGLDKQIQYNNSGAFGGANITQEADHVEISFTSTSVTPLYVLGHEDLLDKAIAKFGDTSVLINQDGSVWVSNRGADIGTVTPNFAAYYANGDSAWFKTSTGTYNLMNPGHNGIVMGARLQARKGANVTSAGDMTLGTDGNLFHITGTTTINAITIANWQAGSEVTFIFDASVTVKNNTAGGGGTAVMLLAGGADFSATSNDVLKLVYDGTSWFEVSRSVN
jgi:hypothetical protein